MSKHMLVCEVQTDITLSTSQGDLTIPQGTTLLVKDAYNRLHDNVPVALLHLDSIDSVSVEVELEEILDYIHCYSYA